MEMLFYGVTGTVLGISVGVLSGEIIVRVCIWRRRRSR